MSKLLKQVAKSKRSDRNSPYPLFKVQQKFAEKSLITNSQIIVNVSNKEDH